MVNKNIFMVLLSTFCFVQSAEYPNSIHIIDIRKRFEKSQQEIHELLARKIQEDKEKEKLANERLQAELERDRAKIEALINQKNRHNQNVGKQKYVHISTKNKKKYNNGKHRNNSGR